MEPLAPARPAAHPVQRLTRSPGPLALDFQRNELLARRCPGRASGHLRASRAATGSPQRRSRSASALPFPARAPATRPPQCAEPGSDEHGRATAQLLHGPREQERAHSGADVHSSMITSATAQTHCCGMVSLRRPTRSMRGCGDNIRERWGGDEAHSPLPLLPDHTSTPVLTWSYARILRSQSTDSPAARRSAELIFSAASAASWSWRAHAGNRMAGEPSRELTKARRRSIRRRCRSASGTPPAPRSMRTGRMAPSSPLNTASTG